MEWEGKYVLVLLQRVQNILWSHECH